jgi:hypothetical protein
LWLGGGHMFVTSFWKGGQTCDKMWQEEGGSQFHAKTLDVIYRRPLWSGMNRHENVRRWCWGKWNLKFSLASPIGRHKRSRLEEEAETNSITTSKWSHNTWWLRVSKVMHMNSKYLCLIPWEDFIDMQKIIHVSCWREIQKFIHVCWWIFNSFFKCTLNIKNIYRITGIHSE